MLVVNFVIVFTISIIAFRFSRFRYMIQKSKKLIIKFAEIIKNSHLVISFFATEFIK